MGTLVMGGVNANKYSKWENVAYHEKRAKDFRYFQDESEAEVRKAYDSIRKFAAGKFAVKTDSKGVYSTTSRADLLDFISRMKQANYIEVGREQFGNFVDLHRVVFARISMSSSGRKRYGIRVEVMEHMWKGEKHYRIELKLVDRYLKTYAKSYTAQRLFDDRTWLL